MIFETLEVGLDTVTGRQPALPSSHGSLYDDDVGRMRRKKAKAKGRVKPKSSNAHVRKGSALVEGP